MRTTLQIDDDVLASARHLASLEAKTLGQVISKLARKGLIPVPQETEHQGFPVFSVSASASPITFEMVQKAAEDK
jgi:hypothetical protein